MSRSAALHSLQTAFLFSCGVVCMGPPIWQGWSGRATGYPFESPDPSPLCFVPCRLAPLGGPFASPLGWSGCGFVCIAPLCRSAPVILRLAALMSPICYAPLASPLGWSRYGVVCIAPLSRSASVILRLVTLMSPIWRRWSVEPLGARSSLLTLAPLCYATFTSPLGWCCSRRTRAVPVL